MTYQPASRMRLLQWLLAGALCLSASVQARSLPEFTELVKTNGPAVVNITTNHKQKESPEIPSDAPGYEEPFDELMKRFFGNPGGGGGAPEDFQADARGSGFVLSADGYIVTNHHVVDGADEILVKLNDRREFSAKLIGSDKRSDVALLKIDAASLPTLKIGDSSSIEVGEWVLAIGSPFGFESSATSGIVSATGRSLPTDTYVPFIQTDVAVNPGNSGGPLFDLNGNVVGVNSQIYSRSGGYMGISFAIPVNLVKNITEQLKTAGVVNRGWLGVQIQNLDQELANSFSMTKPQGALVASVQPSSPADKAGVQAGDIIVGFNNAEVTSADHLPLLVGTTGIGSTVPLKVLRAGAEKILNVTIEKLADKDAGELQEVAQNSTTSTGALGLAVAGLSDQERKEAEIGMDGVVVREVRADSPASRAGLQTGDVIISVNNTGIKSPEELKMIVDKAPTDKPLAMLIQRDDEKRFIAVGRS